jgi:glutamate-1-semialdehyde aminotransferase
LGLIEHSLVDFIQNGTSVKVEPAPKQPAKDLWRRAQESVYNGTSCYKMHPKRFAMGIAPTHITRARGCYVWAENTQYIDFSSANGLCFFGYANETINRAAWQAMQMGPIHTLATHYEILASEKVREIWPFVDKVLWVNSAETAFAISELISADVVDEVHLGFRSAKLTACSEMGHQPTVVVGGGRIANGFPIYFVGLKKGAVVLPEVCAERQDFGEYPTTMAFAAIHAGLTMVQTKKADVGELAKETEAFFERLNELAGGLISFQDRTEYGAFCTGSGKNVALFLQETAKAGLLFGDRTHLNFAHLAPGIFDATFAALEGVFHKMRSGQAKLEIPMPSFWPQPTNKVGS